MPDLLVLGIGPDDSIDQFRGAAGFRNAEAWLLAGSGHGGAAVYLWGYVVEMTIKAAWFALLGYGDDQSIGLGDLRRAKEKALSYKIVWPGNFHDLNCWAQLLIRHRTFLKRPYTVYHFDRALLAHSQRVYNRWREWLRYKKNVPYPFEVQSVAESAGWFLKHSRDL